MRGQIPLDRGSCPTRLPSFWHEDLGEQWYQFLKILWEEKGWAGLEINGSVWGRCELPVREQSREVRERDMKVWSSAEGSGLNTLKFQWINIFWMSADGSSYPLAFDNTSYPSLTLVFHFSDAPHFLNTGPFLKPLQSCLKSMIYPKRRILGVLDIPRSNWWRQKHLGTTSQQKCICLYWYFLKASLVRIDAFWISENK